MAQARPSSLRDALEVSLEVESFTLAAKRRPRPVRAVQNQPTEEEHNNTENDLGGTIKCDEFMEELRRMTCELTA